MIEKNWLPFTAFVTLADDRPPVPPGTHSGGFRNEMLQSETIREATEKFYSPWTRSLLMIIYSRPEMNRRQIATSNNYVDYILSEFSFFSSEWWLSRWQPSGSCTLEVCHMARQLEIIISHPFWSPEKKNPPYYFVKRIIVLIKRMSIRTLGGFVHLCTYKELLVFT